MTKQIELHIEELVLHNFPLHQRYAIAQAFEMELTRLLLEHQQIPGTFQNTGGFPSIDAGSFIINKNTKVEVAGSKIANAVYKSFGK